MAPTIDASCGTPNIQCVDSLDRCMQTLWYCWVAVATRGCSKGMALNEARPMRSDHLEEWNLISAETLAGLQF